MNYAYIRSLEVAGSIPDGRVATAGVPTEKPTVRQRHAYESLQAVGKVNILGERCNYFCSTQFVQHYVVRALKKVGKRLTVLAIANGPGRDVSRADVTL
jgi:hypothetical protein